MKYHVIIKDNKTNETLTEMDACAIIGAINDGIGVRNIGLSNCSFFDTAITICRVEEVISKILDDPLEKAAYEIVKAETKEAEKTENE